MPGQRSRGSPVAAVVCSVLLVSILVWSWRSPTQATIERQPGENIVVHQKVASVPIIEQSDHVVVTTSLASDQATARASELPLLFPRPTCGKALNSTLSPDFAHGITSDYAQTKPAAETKVAICLSGGLRSFSSIHGQLHNELVAPNAADVFVFAEADSAEQLESARRLLASLPWVKAFQLELASDTIAKVSKVIETDCSGDGKPVPQAARMVSMFRKIFLCNELLLKYEQRHGVEYAMIVRSRPDLLLKKPAVDLRALCPPDTLCLHFRFLLPTPAMFQKAFGFLPECTEENSRITPGCANCCPGFSDYFAFGDRKIMQRYAQMVFTIHEYRLLGGQLTGNFPEHFLFGALQRLCLADKVKEVGYSDLGGGPNLIRSNGKVLRL